MISSVNNDKIKKIARLHMKKYRDEENLFLVEGINLVEEAKMQGVLIEIITADSKYEGTLVSMQVMEKICQTASPAKIVGVCRKLEKNILTNRVLILDGLQDPGNIGTLLRSACSFGFKTIFLSNNCVDLYNDKVIRSSQGSIFKLNFLFGESLSFIRDLKNLQYEVFGTNVKNGLVVSQIDYPEKLAIILGNEGNGISEEIFREVEKNLYIPMENMESLNVGVAGSIIMYEIKKLTS